MLSFTELLQGLQVARTCVGHRREIQVQGCEFGGLTDQDHSGIGDFRFSQAKFLQLLQAYEVLGPPIGDHGVPQPQCPPGQQVLKDGACRHR